VAEALRSVATTARDAPAPTAGAIGAIGVVTLIYGASRAFTATGRAMDAIHRRGSHGRSLRRRAADIGWTVLILAIGLVVLVLLTISGRVLEEVLGLLGLSGASVTVWSIARWPIAAALGLLVVAVLVWASPTGRRGPFRPVTPGGVVTVVALMVGTIGYDLYVSYVASYNATYGAFAGAVILLLWIWLASTALLYGAELDAVIDEAGEELRWRTS
jgi:membrane protein